MRLEFALLDVGLGIKMYEKQYVKNVAGCGIRDAVNKHKK